ncbi:hypothetical protein V5O48_015101 [Marasmius crinis-equi]|uniref:Uncharacterized protein n=1 Tax=Marasmius crinis-equi TaxID=585013 RepID=A0ABR3EVR4_9AGAR
MPQYVIDTRYGVIKDPLFVAESIERYPTIRTAIDALRRNGRPGTGYAMSLLAANPPPTTHVETFLQSIVSLASHQFDTPAKAMMMKTNFWRIVVPWFVSLLKDFILCDEKPRTPQGVDCRERTLWIVPFFFWRPWQSLKIVLDIGSDESHRLFADLRSLVAQVWFKLLESSHHTAGSWSRFISAFAFDHKSHLDTVVAMLRASIPIHFSGQPVRVFARYIDQELSRLPLMHLQELHNFSAVMILLGMGFMEKDSLAADSPLGRTPSATKYILPVLVRLLSRLFRKVLPDTPISNPDPDPKYAITRRAMDLIDDITDGAAEISCLLDAGFVEMMWKVHPYHLLLVIDEESGRTCEDLTCTLLRRICRYLIYPTILHRFLITMNRIEKPEGLENDLIKRSPKLWECWQELKEKATILYGVRQKMKATGQFLACSYPENLLNPVMLVLKLVLSVNSCRTVWLTLGIFVAKDVQSRSIVRELVRNTTGNLGIEGFVHGFATSSKANGDILTISEENAHFFEVFVHHYLRRHAGAIENTMKTYSLTPYTLSLTAVRPNRLKDLRLIGEGIRRPIVVLDFESVHNQNPILNECLHVVDPITMEQQFGTRIMFPDDIEDFLAAWRGYDGAHSLAILALLPGRLGRSYLVPLIIGGWKSKINASAIKSEEVDRVVRVRRELQQYTSRGKEVTHFRGRCDW